MIHISLDRRTGAGIPLRGMESKQGLLSGGINKLAIHKTHKPPHIKTAKLHSPQGNLSENLTASKLLLEAFGIELKKVAAQQEGNTTQNMRVDAVAVEDAVTSHTARAQLLAEPSDGAPLSLQFLTDFLSYVDVVGHAAKIRKFVLLRIIAKLRGKSIE